MKKPYETPRIEVTEFRFSEHIAASGTPSSSCIYIWTYSGLHGCENPQQVPFNNN